MRWIESIKDKPRPREPSRVVKAFSRSLIHSKLDVIAATITLYRKETDVVMWIVPLQMTGGRF